MTYLLLIFFFYQRFLITIPLKRNEGTKQKVEKQISRGSGPIEGGHGKETSSTKLTKCLADNSLQAPPTPFFKTLDNSLISQFIF